MNYGSYTLTHITRHKPKCIHGDLKQKATQKEKRRYKKREQKPNQLE